MSSELAIRSPLDLRTIGYETPVSIPCGSTEITLNVKSVIDWICPGADAPAALKFLMTCRNLNLNPLAGDAYLVPMGGKYATVIGKGAYLKKAQECPEYDGHASGITIWTKERGFEDIDGTVRPPTKDILVVGGWARVWRKGVARPIFKRLSFDEYRKKTKTWDEIPLTMIAKAALVAALREAFGLDGYDESESPVDLPAAPVHVSYVEPPPPNRVSLPPSGAIEPEVVMPSEPTGAVAIMNYRTDEPIDYVKPELANEICLLAREADLTPEEFSSMLRRRNVSDVWRLTVAQGEEIVAALEGLIRESQASEVFGPSAGEGAVLIPEIVRPEAKSA